MRFKQKTVTKQRDTTPNERRSNSVTQMSRLQTIDPHLEGITSYHTWLQKHFAIIENKNSHVPSRPSYPVRFYNCFNLWSTYDILSAINNKKCNTIYIPNRSREETFWIVNEIRSTSVLDVTHFLLRHIQCAGNGDTHDIYLIEES